MTNHIKTELTTDDRRQIDEFKAQVKEARKERPSPPSNT